MGRAVVDRVDVDAGQSLEAACRLLQLFLADDVLEFRKAVWGTILHDLQDILGAQLSVLHYQCIHGRHTHVFITLQRVGRILDCSQR